MLLKLFLLFVLVPFVELALLLWLADLTNWRFTLGLVIVTGLIGSLLAKSQGWRAYSRIHSELAAGRLPAEPLMDAVMILVAGALLLTPGVLTDAFGLSLLLPPCRRWYRRQLAAWFKRNVEVRTSGRFGTTPHSRGSEVIDSYVVQPKKENGQDNEIRHLEDDPPT